MGAKMAEITAATVKALREQTGQGMMQCKKALQETGGDLAAAADLLRKKGLAIAEKKAGRETKEGLVAIVSADDGGSAAMVEVQCETDFCAKNDVFASMVQHVADMALAAGVGEVPTSGKIEDAVQQALSKIGENMKYVRGVKIAAAKVGTYVHHNGKVGVMVGVEGDISAETLNDLCMHVAFADPVGITTEDIPAEIVAKEKAFATEEAIASGKPKEIAEKIVAGKMAKFLAGKALLEQPFVRDDKKKVKQVLGGAKVTAFARYAIGG
jgi:elongation factor Ts